MAGIWQLGSVSATDTWQMGAVGAGTVTEAYVLTAHGIPEANSIMEGNQFATTGPVYLGPITGGDTNIANPDWQAISDNQLWLTDINNVSQFNAVAAGTVTYTIPYRIQETGETGSFARTVQVADEVSPAISSVDVPAAATYSTGESLSFTVNWSEAVDVTGTPALNLNIGGSARQANYASGTGTAALVFTYPVQAGDNDADGIAVTSLTLDGGTIQDAAASAALLTLNSVGATSGVLVDGVAPAITVDPLTTLDTSPIVSGSAGDAVSITLVVDGVTYNPTPSGSAWSQQLPTLALGTYTMTLNGADSVGNSATQQLATLSIVSELVSDVLAISQPIASDIASTIDSDITGEIS